MKTKAIKLISLILALLMLVPLIASCGKGGTPPSNEDGADENDSAIDYQAILGFGPENNQDYKFTMLVSDSDSYEHLSKELNSNFVNDAVFKRNIAISNVVHRYTRRYCGKVFHIYINFSTTRNGQW